MGGTDKALVTLHGQTLVARVVARFAPQVDALVLSANGLPDRFSSLGLPVLADDSAQGSRGPLSGIRAAMVWSAGQGGTHVASAAVDTPFLPCDLVPRLCLAAENTSAGFAIAVCDGRDHPTFGLWPVSLLGALDHYLAAEASARMLGFVDANGAARAVFPDAGAFRNINSPADLAEAETYLAALA